MTAQRHQYLRLAAVAMRFTTSGLLSFICWIVANAFLLFFVPLGNLYERFSGPSGVIRLKTWTCLLVRVFFLQLLPFFRFFKLVETPQRWPSGPALLVANHRSWLDALLIIGIVPNVAIPVSIRYFKLPLLSSMMRWLDCVPLDAHDLATTATSVRLLEERLRSGAVVAVFPERRRMPIGELGSFSDIFFRLAADTGAAIWPLLIHNRPQLLGPSSVFDIGDRVPIFRLRLGQAMTPHPKDRAADLARRTRKWFVEQLEPLDKEG